MAIPLPNPNIDDTKKVDNLTWSSNKIAKESITISDNEIENYLSLSETEKKIGKFGNDDLYTITISNTISELTLNTLSNLASITDLNIDHIIKVNTVCETSNGYILTDYYTAALIRNKNAIDVRQNLITTVTGIDFTFFVTLYYTKQTI